MESRRGHTIDHRSKLCRHILAELGPVREIELPQFDENDAAFVGARRVRCGRRVAHIGACGIVAVFILKHALQDDKFFAAGMGMRREIAARRIAHDRRGACHLVTDPVEHTPIHALHRRGLPVDPVRMHDDTPGKIRVELHPVVSFCL